MSSNSCDCRHCGSVRGDSRCRRLCYYCYGDVVIRALYPSLRPADRANWGGDNTSSSRPLPAPTAAFPGTPQKIEVLAARAEAGQQLWHPLDRGLDERSPAEVAERLKSTLLAWC